MTITKTAQRKRWTDPGTVLALLAWALFFWLLIDTRIWGAEAVYSVAGASARWILPAIALGQLLSWSASLVVQLQSGRSGWYPPLPNWYFARRPFVPDLTGLTTREIERTAERFGLSEPPAAAALLPAIEGLGAACLGAGTSFLLTAGIYPRDPKADSFPGWWMPSMLIAVTLITSALRQFALSKSLYQSGRDRAALAARAQAEADRAVAAALQAQMNPHFLFNTLNTVASLLATSPVRARETLRRLSTVLRHTLQRSSAPLSPLRDEIAFVREYLEIERARFGDRLKVTFKVPRDLEDTDVPTLTVQPLVENAVKYALSGRIEGAAIVVSARHDRGRLAVSVEDDGPGFAADYRERGGLGTLRRRLKSLYGDRAALTIDSSSDGAITTMRVPFR